MTRNRDQIIETIQRNRVTIRRYGVRRLGLFGSFAKGTGGAKSDLDFVVEFENKSFDAYMGLKLYLEELFDSPVDLVLINTLKPQLRDHILQEAVYAPEF